MLALGIGRGSAADVLAPLPYGQSAPPLFQLAVRGVTAIGGMGEYSLRVVPFLAGLLLPWLVWRMARALAGPEAGLVAATLAVVSVPLIYHSAELKPYGLDGVVCASLVLLTASARAAPERSSAWWALASAGLVGLLLSAPAPLVMAGAIAGLAVDARVRATPEARTRLVLLVAAWGAGAALAYVLVNRSAATDPYMLSYWGGTFLDPKAADLPKRISGLVHAVLSPLPSSPEWLRPRWLFVVVATGLPLLIRRAGIAAALQISVPFVALVVAAVAHKYPIADRLLLFLAPCTFVVVAVLIVEGLRAAHLGAPKAAGVGVLLVACWGAAGVVRHAHTSQMSGGGRATARRIQEAPADEPVYVMSAGLPVWAYYATDWGRPDTTRLKLFERLGAASGPAARNDLVAPAAEFPLSALQYDGSGRLELIGVRSGLSYREPGTLARRSPDPLWARREVDRMGGTGRRYIWIFGAHRVGSLLPALRMELARRGMIVVEMVDEEYAVALRVRMPNHLVDSRYREPSPPRP